MSISPSETSVYQHRLDSVDFAIPGLDDGGANEQACADVRNNINNQLDTLCADDLSMHFTVRDILAGLIKIKNTQADNG